jgi:putative transposase
MTGISRSTWHYRQHPRERVAAPIPQLERAYESRIGAADRERICEMILAGWAQQNSVDHAFATAWDAGVMLASRRSWWRIAGQIENQMLRPKVPTRKERRQPRDKPVLKATGPGQVWSWDITDLYSPWRGKVFKAYKITDIYSRKIVGWSVEDREADHLAVAMFNTAIAGHGAPSVVHADSGAAMTSNLLRNYLHEQGVDLSHNRPYVSNDNPFSEAGFRTMKYRPGYPKVFTDLDTARQYIAGYVPWYNHQHKHSGIALFSPADVHDGTWEQIWEVRDAALQRYFEDHPARFRARPTTPTPADTVGINLPNEKLQIKAA